jgi:predicted naringenin-chalcone synthase
MSVSILGIGTTVPRNFVDQTNAVHMVLNLINRDVKEGWHLEEIYLNAGISKRHSVLLEGPGGYSTVQSFFPKLDPSLDLNGRHGPGTDQRMDRYYQEAVPLAVDACRQALSRADIDPSKIDHLVTVSCTGFVAPGVDCSLIDELGLSAGVSRTQVGFMGCHGAFNGLRVARAQSLSEPQSTVLVCAVELCSIHFDYGWGVDRVLGNSLFSDGAGAAVVCREPSSSNHEWKLIAQGSYVVPNTKAAITWRVGNRGFEMMLSRRIPSLILKNLKPWLSAWLQKQGLSIEDIGTWAVHPGGPSILTSVEHALSLKEEALEVSRGVLDEYGNMSSATILFILDRLQKRGADRPCVALGFGPGLTVEAMLLR